MSSEDYFETREEAWAALYEALSTMLDEPKVVWPEDVESQREKAEEFLRANPPTPATQVTMRLSRESLAEVVDAVVLGVHDALQAGASDSESGEALDTSTGSELSPLHAETVLEFSDDANETSSDHVCRANLDVDDRCTVCGEIYVTGVRIPLVDGQPA